MKVKLTEQQVKNIVTKANSNDLDNDMASKAAALSNFFNKISNVKGTKPSYEPTNDYLGANQSSIKPDDYSILPEKQKFTFSRYIPSKPNEMLHPLGKKTPISSEFGLRSAKVGGSDHKGIDLATPSGSPVYAPLDGVVEAAKDTSPNACGGFIQLNHSTIYTKYCHLKQIIVKSGQKVKKGQLIGYSGGGKNDPMRGRTTGPHLHYEILNSNKIAMNPVSVQTNLAEEDVKY